ncbi:MAG: universal stress protein [Bacteroidales bacterium]|nr:universal stress protein [Bacteroidales bacterium]
MNKNSILIPVDFSEASSSAIKLAANLAKIDDLSLTLLHITSGNNEQEVMNELKSTIDQIALNGHPKVEYKVRKGKLIDEISSEACEDCYRYMIIGSHGFKGIREKIMGTDILKLLKTLPVPVICIQKGYELPETGIKKILFPASEHEAFSQKIQATLLMAVSFKAEVFIYTVQKPGTELSGNLRGNIRMAKAEFATANIPFTEVTEPQENFSIGYSKQIMAFASKNGMEMISLMLNPTQENYYFADSDKERILTNDLKIPVLCTNDKYPA